MNLSLESCPDLINDVLGRLGATNIKVFKGTVRVILSDPLFKDGNSRFTTVPLKHLSDQ